MRFPAGEVFADAAGNTTSKPARKCPGQHGVPGSRGKKQLFMNRQRIRLVTGQKSSTYLHRVRP